MEYCSRRALTTLIFCLSLVFPPQLSLAASELELQRAVERRLLAMSPEEKVGQLFMVGFSEKEMTPELEDFIKKHRPGSFILFKRNITSLEQVRNLNFALRRMSYKYTRLPPLIAVDQEGGSVSRLPIFPAPPNALAIGQTRIPLLAEGIGYEIGRFLREAGFNMNLAPVLDVSDPFVPSFIGLRSFGRDPSVVSEMGTAYASGLLKSRVIPTAKHFPGTGSLSGDPHLEVIKNESSLSSLTSSDLKPFESYVELGRHSAIMLSHLIYPALDAGKEPASFSRKITTDLLRLRMKYMGLVLTDDLQMQGSRALFAPESAAVRALAAGADIVMLTWSRDDQEKSFRHVMNAVRTGMLSSASLNEKVRRILLAKAFANIKPSKDSPLENGGGQPLTSPAYAAFESQILDHNLKLSLTSSRQEESPVSHRLPTSLERICVFAPSSSFLVSFKKNIRIGHVESKFLRASTRPHDLQQWARSKGCSVSLLVVTGKKTAELIKSLSLEQKRRAVVVNLSAPSHIPNDQNFLKVLQLYFSHTESGKKIAQNLEEILREINFNVASD